MQRKALKELNRMRAIGNTRSLVVSATGSGKTYLAAFDARNFDPQRLLYIVHEGSILKKSLETFQEVFGGAKTLEKQKNWRQTLSSQPTCRCAALWSFSTKRRLIIS